MLKELRVRIALVIVLAALAGGSIVAAIRSHAPAETPITITTAAADVQSATDPATPASADSSPAAGAIEVHITGAVKAPNLYQLPADSRLADAVKMAGGAKDDADLDAVNLAEKLRDGEKIYVPTHADTKAIPPMVDAAPQNTIGDQPAAPDVTSDATSTMSGSDTTTTPGSPAKTKKGSSSKANKLTNPSQGTVNINTASAADLMRLPGVGKATAAHIIAYRAATPFKKPEDIMNVSGIGPKKFAKMQPFIRVS